MKTFTYTLLLFLVLGILNKLDAQCSGGTITLQNNINALSGCGSIIDDITISGTDITDLTPLSLVDIQGSITIDNCTNLTSLAGLDNLTQINGKFRIFNSGLVSLNTTMNLETVTGDVEIYDNNAMTSLGGMPLLSSIGGKLSIRNNSVLVNIIEFESLATISSDLEIWSSGALSEVDLPELVSVGAAMSMLSNAGNFELDGFNKLQTVTNGIQLNGNSGLTSITGFNGISTLLSLFIEEHASLTSVNAFQNMTSAGVISFKNNNSLQMISGFADLQTTTTLEIFQNGVLTTLGGFGSLTTVNGQLDIIDNAAIAMKGASNASRSIDIFTALNSVGGQLNIINNGFFTSISGFNNLSSAGGINIDNNIALSSISGFSSVSSVSGTTKISANGFLETISGFTNMTSGSILVITNNPSLTTVNGFTNYTNGVQNVEIVGNPALSMCCWALPSIAAASSASVSGNAAGCASVAEIDQSPTFDSCPTDVTVNTDPNLCSAMVELTDPDITDNCGYTSYTYDITLGNGFNETGPAEEGFFFDYELPAGDNEFIWNVTDESGNSSECITNVRVEDSQSPVFTSAIPADVTISTSGPSCSAMYGVTFPTFMDNCTSTAPRLTIFNNVNSFVIEYDNTSPVGGTTYNVDLPVGEFTVEFSVNDGNGNSVFDSYFVTVVDGGVPVITLNQADITISCNDQVPPAAAIGSAVFASDGCNGDLTSQLSLSTSGSGSPDCIPGAIKEEIVHSYTVIDAANNISIASYKITVINDRQADLGPNRTVCPGNTETLSPTGLSGTYMWSTGATTPTIEVTNSGTYGVTITGASGCCSEAEVTITFVDSPDASATGGVIGCTATTVQLMGSSSTPDVDYYWTGPGGFMSEMQNPTVSSVGEYTLTVISTASCETVVTTMVTADTDVPDASATGGTLDCSNSAVQLMGSSTTAGVTYAWTGPGGYTSSDQNPTVSAAGIYTLTVMASNGCEVTADAEVVDDTGAPMVEVETATLTCTNTSIDLMPLVTGDVATYSWTGPAGFTSSDMNISVDAAGTYTLVSTGTNDCETTTEVVVEEDVTVPDVSATGGELTCEVSELTLLGSSTTENVTFMWAGPDGYEADIQNPVAFLPGSYTLTVTAANGCQASETVEVTSETELPVVTAEGGTVTCTDPSLMVEATSESEGVTYSWTGPADFTAVTAVVNLTEAGTYTVMVTNGSGCSGQTTVEVIADQIAPTVEASIADLNCAMDEAIAEVMASDDVVAYAWTGPEDFSSVEEGPAISIAGTYTLVVTAENGCTSSLEVEVSGDYAEPGVEATGGMITCINNAVSLLATTEASGVSFAWSGPDEFTSVLAGPEVSVPGEYTVTVTGENGCTSTATAIVTADSDLPNVMATGGVLDCNNSMVTLAGSTSTEGASIMWEGPDGFTSEEANVQVTVAGEYTFTVTSSAGCSAFSTVMVSEDFSGPEVEFALGDVSCENGTVTVLPSVIEGLSFSWTGPNGFTSSEELPAISMGGLYMVTVTGANGCTRDTSVVLPADVGFSVEVFVDTSSASLDVIGGNGPFAIKWSDGTMSTTVVGLEDGEHSVSVTDAFGCTVVETFTTMSSSTVDLVAAAEVVAFPNPAIDYITLEWSSSAEVAVRAITILDHAGRRISHETTGPGYTHQMDISSLPQGVYIIQVAGDEGIGALKFVKL